MTEAEWFAATDPLPMLRILSEKVSLRKRRLFACGCCRQIDHLIVDQKVRAALALAERAADKSVSFTRLTEAFNSVWDTITEPPEDARAAPARAVAAAVLPLLGHTALNFPLKEARRAFERDHCDRLPPRGRRAFRRADRLRWCRLVRDVAGNPFRRLRIAPEWKTPLVLALARRMYDDGDFSALPVLADALEESGYSEATVLDHLRGPGPHVRGCWVVDLLILKKGRR